MIGAVVNTCDLLPGITPQPAAITTRFDAPDSIASDTTVNPAGLGASCDSARARTRS
ncbi:hypothetical protein [Amycolatopsis sp.]|uniref:hypothetical protein n=1 Tax=Amycolatopsis sp. TaxID=37632 RepID=UPI002D7F0166|nr:hypothetical protein [Amycolatopsis sp.]HET6708385.1 hypothetical protein [Amycolatopsis sp.]